MKFSSSTIPYSLSLTRLGIVATSRLISSNDGSSSESWRERRYGKFDKLVEILSCRKRLILRYRIFMKPGCIYAKLPKVITEHKFKIKCSILLDTIGKVLASILSSCSSAQISSRRKESKDKMQGKSWYKNLIFGVTMESCSNFMLILEHFVTIEIIHSNCPTSLSDRRQQHFWSISKLIPPWIVRDMTWSSGNSFGNLIVWESTTSPRSWFRSFPLNRTSSDVLLIFLKVEYKSITAKYWNISDQISEHKWEMFPKYTHLVQSFTWSVTYCMSETCPLLFDIYTI